MANQDHPVRYKWIMAAESLCPTGLGVGSPGIRIISRVGQQMVRKVLAEKTVDGQGNTAVTIRHES